MSEPSRNLPSSPSLEQQKKQAKELLRALQEGDEAALQRVLTHLPDKADLTLADAQFVIAREYGFDNWAELTHHIEQQERQPQDIHQAFRRAFEKRDARALRALFERHPDARAMIDAPLFPFDSPALAHFSGGDNVELIDVLLEFGADPNRRTSWWAGGFHPLHGASAAVAERLIRAGAEVDACAAAHLDRVDLLQAILDEDPQRVHERGGDGQTPLHFARSRAVVDLLLEHRADIDARDVDHRSTPAQWMLDRKKGAGRYELALYLVERGAAVDVFLAAALGLSDRLRALQEADPSLVEERTGQGDYAEQPPSSYHIYFWTIGQNRSPLQVAAQFDQQEARDVIRSFVGPKQLFLEACAVANADEARRLLQQHPVLMHEITPADHRALADAAWAGDAPAVELMLELGFDPRVRGHDSGSALHCAAWVGCVACVQAILRHADRDPLVHDRDPLVHDRDPLVHDRDPHYDATPLGWCLHGSMNCGDPKADHAVVARLLLDAGAEPPADTAELPAAVRTVIREYGG